MKKKVLAVILTVAILSSLVVTAAGAVSVSDFADVSSDSWYYESVDFVSSKGYMIGVGTTPETFAPEYNMTRAMFVTVLARVAGVEVDNTKSSFDDVKVNEWYTGAVAWAVEAGITTGIGGNNFAPEAFVTREDMATFMSRFVTWYGKTTNQTHRTSALVDGFTDEDSIREYAKDAVEQCRQWGLINGYDNGAFGPQDFSTRAQVAAVISRLYWIVNSSSSGGGGGHNHTVTVNLSSTVSVLGYNNPSVILEASFTDDATVSSIVKKLVAGSNKDALEFDISKALEKACPLHRSFPTQVSGMEATIIVDINEDGVVSATANVPMSVLFAAENGTLAANVDYPTEFTMTEANKETAKALLEMIQNDQGVQNVTVNDLAVLNYIIENKEKIDEEFVTEAINNASSEIQTVVGDLNAADIVSQVHDYIDTVLVPVQEDIVVTVAEATGVPEETLKSKDASAITAAVNEKIAEDDTINVEDVTSITVSPTVAENVATVIKENETLTNVTIDVDLAGYLAKITGDTQAEGRYVEKLCNYLKKTGSEAVTEDDVKAYVNAISNVSGFITPVADSKNVKLSKTASDYTTYISGVVDASVNLYESLEGDEAFYTKLLTAAQNNAVKMGFPAEATSDTIELMAKILAANKVTHDDAVALAKLNMSASIVPADHYAEILDYVQNSTFVPQSIKDAVGKYAPESLDNIQSQAIKNALSSTYTATVKVS